MARLESRPIYVPLLKGLAAEYGALESANDTTRGLLLPFIDVPPIPWDFKLERPKKTLAEHIGEIPKKLAKCWGRSPVLLDLFYLQEGEIAADGSHPMTFLSRECCEMGLSLVPVTGSDRSSEYQAAIKAANDTTKCGACLRLGRENLLDTASVVGALAEQVGVRRQACDLVFDLRQVSYEEVPELSRLLAASVAAVPRLDEWRTVVVAATGMPPNLASVQKDSARDFPRTEVWLWRSLFNQRAQLGRTPLFGDYGVTHPDPVSVDPRKIRMSANLRYTLEDHVLVLKGRRIRDAGCEQFRGICRRLIARGAFAGPECSWGDAFIAACANGLDSQFGNATTWLRIGTSHHLEVVVAQIARQLAA